MRRWKLLVGAGCVAPLTGCNLYQLAGRNLYNEPTLRADEHRLDCRLEEEARLAWREVCRQYPERSFTTEFADGFQEGYADHLQNGGPPRPAAVPPIKYRRSRYYTPAGSLRVKDYLCGTRYGAEVAAATGYREFLTVPLMLAEPRPDAPLNIVVLPPPPDPAAEPAAGDKPAPPLPTGTKPAPKPLDPAPAPPVQPPAPPADPPAVVVPKVEPAPPPKLEPGRPDPVPLPKPADPLPKFDPPLGTPPKAPPPAATPLRPGETGTGLPAIDLPFPDFLAPPGGIKPQAGSSADPGRVEPAGRRVPAPAVPPPVVRPPGVPPAAIAPPRPRPPADAPPPQRNKT